MAGGDAGADEGRVPAAVSAEGEGEKGVMGAGQRQVEELLRRRRPLSTLLVALSGAILFFVVAGLELGMASNDGDMLYSCRRMQDDCVENKVYPAGDSASRFTATNAIRMLTGILMVVRAVFIVKWHRQDLDILKFKGRYPVNGSMRGARLRSMLLETLVLVIHPFPFMEAVSTNPYLFVLTVLPALYSGVVVVPRFAYQHSALNTSQGRFVSAMTQVPHTPSFVLRSFLRESIGSAVAFFMLLSLMVCAYSFRIVESALCAHDKIASQCAPVSLSEAIYTIGVTMTTIGYGAPHVPFTNFGRVIVLVGGLCGFAVTGLFVATLMSIISLNSMESRVVRLLEKHRYRLEQQRAASDVIKVAWYYKKHYSGSLLWRTGRFGLVYRQVSVRVPLEIRVMSRLHRNRRARRLKNTHRLNAHPMLAMEQLMLFISMHFSDLVDYFQGIAEVREEWQGELAGSVAASPRAIEDAGEGKEPAAAGSARRASIRQSIVGSAPLNSWQDSLLSSFEALSDSADRVNHRLDKRTGLA